MTRRHLGALAFTVMALLVVMLTAARRIHGSRTFQLFGHLVGQVETADSVVALTFDDGPVPAAADSLLATLSDRGVHATFFVTGRGLATAPALAARLVHAGHELGNHSYSHTRMLLMSQRRIRDEVEQTDSLIRAAGQRGPIYFRPPYGDRLVGLPWFLARSGRTTVMWSIEPDSYAEVAASPDRIVAYVLGRVRPGSIILLHPWYPVRQTSRASVGPLIDSLHARGYRVVPVGELIALGARHGGPGPGSRPAGIELRGADH